MIKYVMIDDHQTGEATPSEKSSFFVKLRTYFRSNPVMFGITVISLLFVAITTLYFLSQKNASQKIVLPPSPTLSLAPSPSFTPAPSPTATPFPSPIPKPTLKPTTPQAKATSGSFTCTLFLGYSQTNNWFPTFHSMVGDMVCIL